MNTLPIADRFWMLAWAVAAVALGSVRADDEALRVVNWNVLYGFNHGKSLAEASEWLLERSPGVVAFQELNGISESELGRHASAWGHGHAATHKEGGFPVGLTSRAPITVVERRSEGFHHGFLHARTYDIHFFVVHFWPGKPEDVKAILDRARPLLARDESVVILGDFNGCSRRDEEFLHAHATLREIDYTFVDLVEAEGFVDIVNKHDPNAKISCPSPITIPRWSRNLEELRRKQYRIDFVFADERLGRTSISGTIARSKVLDGVSDHYPVVVDFRLPNRGEVGSNGGESR